MANDPAAPASTTSPATQPERALRLLDAIYPVCSHDLPNQAVALQSMLQLFTWDEADKLSPQGREYLERLQSIAGKTMAMVHYLREIVRLQRHEARIDNLTFVDLDAEIRAELSRSYPERTWHWESRWNVATLTADRRMVQQGVIQLLRSVLAADAGREAKITMTSAATDEHVEWTLLVAQNDGPASMKSDAVLLEGRLAATLAQDYLATADIACRTLVGTQPGATGFSLTIRKRSLHG